MTAVRREYPLFLIGTGLIALHIADDNFLQPQPGTTALDHLASGLLPLALLAAAAWFYPRLRAGARAIIALGVGLFGVGAGILEAGYYSYAVAPPATTTPACSPSRPVRCSSDSEPSPCGGAANCTTADAAGTPDAYFSPWPASWPPTWWRYRSCSVMA